MGRFLGGRNAAAFALIFAGAFLSVHLAGPVYHGSVGPPSHRGRAAPLFAPAPSPPVPPPAPPSEKEAAALIQSSVPVLVNQLSSKPDTPQYLSQIISALQSDQHSGPRPTPFSIVWLSDTQNMSYYRYPGRLAEVGEWIDGERENRGIEYVVQTGDAVENGFSDWQWAEFDTCYNEFRDDLPYFAIAGNHELSIKRKDYSAYLMREYVKNIPPENSFEDGRAAYATFTAGGVDFILVGAGWDSEVNAAPWMNEVLQQNRDRVAILLFHGYLTAEDRYTKIGKQMFDLVVKPNPNVRLVLCGHVCGTAYREDKIDDTGDGIPDRSVSAMMYNYQREHTDTGQIRILTFDPATHDLTVTTYSPPLKRYFRDSHFQKAEFIIDNAF